jgi:hypothetical protein
MVAENVMEFYSYLSDGKASIRIGPPIVNLPSRENRSIKPGHGRLPYGDVFPGTA